MMMRRIIIPDIGKLVNRSHDSFYENGAGDGTPLRESFSHTLFINTCYYSKSFISI